jgi:acetylglutamate kinase
MKNVWVVKVSGNDLSDEGFLARLAGVLKGIRTRHPLALVHGGGREIAEMHHRLGVQYEFVEGLRATSADGIRLVEMVLSGLVNTRLVRTLVHHGVPAQGISGVDAGLIRVAPRKVGGRSLGFVGEIRKVNPAPLERMLKSGLLPVLSPVSLGPE